MLRLLLSSLLAVLNKSQNSFLGIIKADFTSKEAFRVEGFVETIGTSFQATFPINEDTNADKQVKGLNFSIIPPTMDFFKLPNILSELKIVAKTADADFNFIHEAEPRVSV